MPTLVRTWNLFHGNAAATGGGIAATGLLEEMIRRVTWGRPAVVCLQEVPPAALPRLEEWSGLRAYGVVARRPSLGPLPLPVGLGARLTALNPALLRSALSGQANAILVRNDVAVLGQETLPLNPAQFVQETASLLGLDPLAQLAWAKESRVAQGLRLRLPDGRGIALVATHATSFPSDPAVPDAEVARAARWLATLAAPGEIAVLAGDLNVPPHASPALQALAAAGFSEPAPGIDQILVRGASVLGPPVTWPDETRTTATGLVLSDHAPVEVTIA
jgi:hypothetical protein